LSAAGIETHPPTLEKAISIENRKNQSRNNKKGATIYRTGLMELGKKNPEAMKNKQEPNRIGWGKKFN
jgi:hypothetical protein